MAKFIIRVSFYRNVFVYLIINCFIDPWGIRSFQLCILMGSIMLTILLQFFYSIGHEYKKVKEIKSNSNRIYR